MMGYLVLTVGITLVLVVGYVVSRLRTLGGERPPPRRLSKEIFDRFPREFSVRVIGIIVALIISVAIASNAVAIVPAGYRGVLISWGGRVEPKILEEGLSFKTPFVQSVVKMNVQIQKAESTESTATNDLQEVSTTVAVNFRLDPSQVNVIYQTLAHDYVNRVIRPNIEESLKASTAQFNAEELITKRASLKAVLDNILEERLRIFGIEVLSVSLTDFQFSRSFDEAIETKVTAEQEALTAKNILERIKYEAQQQIIQAEAEKNATIARALGVAEAKLIDADATAEAIKLITEQMTSDYALYLWLTQWDGKLPVFVGGEGSTLMIDISKLLESVTP